MESTALLAEYLRKYIARVPGESFGDIFLQYADDNFEAIVKVNKQQIVMNKEEYAKFLDDNSPVKPPLYHDLSTKIDISTSQLLDLKAKFTTIYTKGKSEKGYSMVNERQYYSIQNNKITRLLHKRSDYLNFDSLEKLDYIKKYQEIPFKDITLKWHSNYYDGMLSGVAEYENKLVWFNCIDDIRDYLYVDDDMYDKNIPGFNFYRRFLIYELSQDDIEHLTYWHNLFCKHVGNHTNYINNNRSGDPCLPSDTHHLFYEPYKMAEPHDYCKGTPIGWFQL